MNRSLVQKRLGLGENFGILSLAFATEKIHFPATGHDILRKIGGKSIMWRRNAVIQLSEVLKEDGIYSTFVDIVCAVSNHNYPEEL